MLIPRERYPRFEYAPYSVEFILKYDEKGNLCVVTPCIDFCAQNDKKMINTINIFLSVFGECLYKQCHICFWTRLGDAFKIVKSRDFRWEIARGTFDS